MSPLINMLFDALVSLFVVSLVVLTAGCLLVRLLRQPIERVRTIQVTLAVLVLAVTIRQAALLPTWSVAVLPPAELDAVQAAPSPPPKSAKILVDRSTSGVLVPIDQPHLPGQLAVEPMMNSFGTPAQMGMVNPASAQADVTSTHSSQMGLWQAFQLACLVAAASGTAWFAGMLVIGRVRLSRLLCKCHAADDSLLENWSHWPSAKARGTRVFVTDATDVPLTCGVRRPIIILPQRLIGQSNQRIVYYCLNHEWAHVRSRDIATWWGMHSMLPVVWFQPLYWRLRRALRIAQDQLADDFAAGRSESRTDYAQLLVDLATHRLGAWSEFALSMADRKSTLFRRVEMLLSRSLGLTHVARRRVVIATAGSLALVAISLCVLRLDRAAADEAPADVAEPPASSPLSKKDREGVEDAEQRGVGATEQKPKQENAEQAAEELSYSGTVVNRRTKEPVPGATVVVRRMISTSMARRVLEETTHTTDQSGKYQFRIPPVQTAEPALYIELDVEHPDYAWKKRFGYALSMIRTNERLGEEPFFSHVDLWPAEPITGRVIDSDGKPLAGVDIQAYSRADADDYGSFFRSKTEADGRFTLNMIEGGHSVFWVVPENDAPVQIVSGTKRGDWGDITVSQGVSITGRVLGATGEPVAGVWVNLEDRESQNQIQMPVATSMRRSGLTDSAGNFSLGPMNPGKIRLEVGEYPQEVKFHQRERQPVEIEDVFIAKEMEIGLEDAGRPIVVQAVPYVEFHGQYVDSSGKPRRGHEVMIYGNLNGAWFHTRLSPDENGMIFGKLPHGLDDATMDAITNEHSALQVRIGKDGELRSGRRLELGTVEGDVTDVEIIRYQAPIVQLKPVDEDGNLMQGAKVAGVYTDGKDELMHPVDGKPTNIFFEEQRDGRFRTSQMVPDREVAFTASAENYEDATVTISLPEGEEKELVVVLKPKNAK